MTQSMQLAKDALSSFERWFSERVLPVAANKYAAKAAGWKQELDGIRRQITSPDVVRVALLGTTGAGKSSFLNALVEQELLPVGVMEPCTAFVTSVRHDSAPGYELDIRYCTREEWLAELKRLVASIQVDQAGDTSEDAGESRRLTDAAWKRIEAVYRVHRVEIADASELARKALPSEVEAVLRDGDVHQRFESAKEMSKALKKLVRGESAVWPLVKSVAVRGAYPRLPQGIEIVDLPGLNDPNEARVEVTRDFLRSAPFVWVLFNMVRGLTEDIQRILRDSRILRTLVLRGTHDGLTLVGTKADDIDQNTAEQLGLDEDCSSDELVATYRKEAIKRARKQLVEMIQDLSTPSDSRETMNRLLEYAKRVEVHATSANAYLKLKRIGGFRKDYGIESEEGTGVPDVHRHLSKIAESRGEVHVADQARKSLDQLAKEIEFFFRAQAGARSRDVEAVRTRFQTEHDQFCRDAEDARSRAKDRLSSYRERFLQEVRPLLEASVRGVDRATDGWSALHWATLMAVVQRDGMFKSHNGKMHDFNTDLAEPLLSHLPVAWERYFTDQVGQVRLDLAQAVGERARAYGEKLELIADVALNRKPEGLRRQIEWFKDRIESQTRKAGERILTAVRQRRTDLAARIPAVAQERLQPAYDGAKVERGAGMKRRILDRLKPCARDSAKPVFETIRTDLVQGLEELEAQILGMTLDLIRESSTLAKTLVDNANLDIQGEAMPAEIQAILNNIPGNGSIAPRRASSRVNA